MHCSNWTAGVARLSLPSVPGLRSKLSVFKFSGVGVVEGSVSVTYKVALKRDEQGGEFPTHVSHLLPLLPGQNGSGLPYISHSSRSLRADVLPATLHGCLALHLPTTVHRPTALL